MLGPRTRTSSLSPDVTSFSSVPGMGTPPFIFANRVLGANGKLSDFVMHGQPGVGKQSREVGVTHQAADFNDGLRKLSFSCLQRGLRDRDSAPSFSAKLHGKREPERLFGSFLLEFNVSFRIRPLTSHVHAGQIHGSSKAGGGNQIGRAHV